MQEEENYKAASTDSPGIFAANTTTNDDNNHTYYHHHDDSRTSMPSYHHDSEVYNNHTVVSSMNGGASVMVDYMLNTPTTDAAVSTRATTTYQDQQSNNNINCINNNNNNNNVVDRTLSFADVMHFADFGSKLALNHPQTFHQQHQNNDNSNTNTGIIEDDDPVYFLKFPVLSNSHMMLDRHNSRTIIHDHSITDRDNNGGEEIKGRNHHEEEQEEDNNPVQLEFLGNNAAYGGNNVHEEKLIIKANNEEGGVAAATTGVVGNNNKTSSSNSKRKRPRSVKTNEEVESQRMTHIAVERNRRKQMNEHLRVLRSLMPSSYVQRGDQASIIGGAIEFVRELEQLLQCLESQKRRRLYGDQPQPPPQQQPQPPPQMGFPSSIMANNQFPHQENEQQLEVDSTAMPMPMPGGGLLQEETAESKSCVADVEVKVLGFDALIKILSRRRPGQLIKVIAALEDLQFTILHTNITAIEQTVLYSFNVKVASEARFTAEDIAGSVQQIFTFIHVNTNVI